MTIVEGGLRARLIHDSFEEHVRSILTARSWFAAGRAHAPITFLSKPLNWDEPIDINTIAITSSDVDGLEMEMGSNMMEDRWTYYVDFFAENEAVGTDLSNDIRDGLRGKLPSAGFTRTSFPVLDFREATPSVLFHCETENVLLDRAKDFPKPWLRWWYSIRVDIVDENDA